MVQKEKRDGKLSGGKRGWDVNPDVIDACMRKVGIDKETLLDLAMKRQLKEQKQAGPDLSTLNKTLKNRFASRKLYSLLLNVLQEKYLEKYASGVLTRENAPMVVDLNQWPSAKMKREYYAGSRGPLIPIENCPHPHVKRTSQRVVRRRSEKAPMRMSYPE